MSNNAIWITWEYQVRNRSLSSRLGVELHEIIVNSSRITRYLKSFLRTIGIIRSKRPKAVIAPNPSIVLACSLLVLKKLYGFSIVTDAHFAGVMARNKIPFFQSILNYYNKKADLVIVTNEVHADFIRSIGGKAFVCQDPLPVLPAGTEFADNYPEKTIFFICSFSKDEPIHEVLQAHGKLRAHGFSIAVSGNYKKLNLDPAEYPGINFLGYIPSEDFYGHLRHSSVIIDLTNNENCLVCGAYEAVSAGKPLVLSKTYALTSYFGDAVVFTKHTPEDIAESIIYAHKHRAFLSLKVAEWARWNRTYMEGKIRALKKKLEEL